MGPGVSPPLLSRYDPKPGSGFDPECMLSCREERGRSAIQFHIETFSRDILETEDLMETFVAEVIV